MDVVSRIKQFMEATRLSPSQFADTAGIPRPTLSQLFNGRNGNKEGARKVSSEFLSKIHEAFPDLNMMWVLFGDGDMVINSNIKFSEPEITDNFEVSSTENADTQDFFGQNLFDNSFQNFTPEKFTALNSEAPPTHVSTQQTQNSTFPTQQPTEIPSLAFSADTRKRIQSIMVFYSDNSYEVFKPVKESRNK